MVGIAMFGRISVGFFAGICAAGAKLKATTLKIKKLSRTRQFMVGALDTSLAYESDHNTSSNQMYAVFMINRVGLDIRQITPPSTTRITRCCLAELGVPGYPYP
jgi:hypothetical protein